MPPPTLYRAPYVVTSSGPLLEDGGVLLAAGRILAVDRFSRLRQEAAQAVALDGCILTPALINCHNHLELSYLAELGQDNASPQAVDQAAGDMTVWIRRLLARRAVAVPPATVLAASRAALLEQYRRGVAVVADIGNQAESLAIGSGQPAEHLFFHEFFGVTAQAAQSAIAALPAAAQACATAHALYSCHPTLLLALKERARRAGSLFPIHVAESAAETEFLENGSGPFHDFLEEWLRMSGALPLSRSLRELVTVPGCGPVQYLDRLQLLDHRTLCVHSVHVSESDADILARRGARVCLCPGSNRRLGVGTAPVERYVRRGMLPGLGTDSLSSNPCTDLWREMQLLQEEHPGLDPALIFAMATRGGAESLGLADRLGSIAPGRQAKLLSIPFTGPAAEVFPFLVSSGLGLRPDWLEADRGR